MAKTHTPPYIEPRAPSLEDRPRWTPLAFALYDKTTFTIRSHPELSRHMRLGFVSAIFPELSFDEVARFAGENGFSSVEVMCWPPGDASRRYAGVSHIDVDSLNPAKIDEIHRLLDRHKIAVSGLGYYPNPLSSDSAESSLAVAHLRKVIDAAARLNVKVVNSFIGRDHKTSIDDNWPRFLETWKPLVAHAESKGIKIGIENCPMLFGADEWPGGKNLATTPAVWRRMFADIPSPNFGLNFDPSHFVWQRMDYLAPLVEFRDRLFHVHAKDARTDLAALDQHGVLSYPKLWHTPKIPGLGDVTWGAFFGAFAMPATTATSPSKSRTAPSKARSKNARNR